MHAAECGKITEVTTPTGYPKSAVKPPLGLRSLSSSCFLLLSAALAAVNDLLADCALSEAASADSLGVEVPCLALLGLAVFFHVPNSSAYSRMWQDHRSNQNGCYRTGTFCGEERDLARKVLSTVTFLSSYLRDLARF